MHILTFSLFCTCIFSTTPYLITPTGAIALAKIQQQKTKALANVLKARAERNIAIAKLGSLPSKTHWVRSSPYYEQAEPIEQQYFEENVRQEQPNENFDVPCSFGKCANPSDDPIQELRLAQHPNDKQEESQNMWAMEQMNNNRDVLDPQEKSADPTHSHSHTYFRQKTHGFGHGGLVQPHIQTPVNVHVVQNQGSVVPSYPVHSSSFSQSSLVHGGQGLQNQGSVVPSYPVHSSSFSQSSLVHGGEGFGYTNNNNQFGGQLVNSGGHATQQVHSLGHGGSNSQIAQVSGHGNSVVQNQNVHSGASGVVAPFLGSRMGEEIGDIAVTSESTLNLESSTEASTTIATTEVAKSVVEVFGGTEKVLTTPNAVESTTPTEFAVQQHSTTENKGTTTQKPLITTEAEYEEEGFIIPTDSPLQPLTGKNDSTWSSIKKVFYVPKGKTITIIPVLHIPMNYTGKVDPLELIILDHRKNGSIVLNSDFNPPITKRKKIVKMKNSSEESSEEKNSSNTTMVNDDPSSIYKILAEEVIKHENEDSSKPQVADDTMEVKKIIFSDKNIKIDVFPVMYLPKSDNTENITHSNESMTKDLQDTSQSKLNDNVENNSTNVDNNESTLGAAKPEWDELTKEIIRNASKIPYVRPVAPLNSSYSGPKGPIKKIKFFPAGSHVELNPMMYIPKTYNGSIDPEEIFVDRRDKPSLNQTDFVNTGRSGNERERYMVEEMQQNEGRRSDEQEILLPSNDDMEMISTNSERMMQNRNRQSIEEPVLLPYPTQNFEDDNTLGAAKSDEVTKEVIKNVSKIPHFRPVAFLNSSDANLKGTIKKIGFIPDASHVDQKNNSVLNHTDFVNTENFRRSKTHQAKNVAEVEKKHVISNDTQRTRPKHLPLKPVHDTFVPHNQRAHQSSSYSINQKSAYNQQPNPSYYQEPVDQQGLELNKQFKYYFQPFYQSDLRDTYLNRENYYNNGYEGKEYQQLNSDLVALPNTQSFKDGVGSYDHGDVYHKSQDYYDHERLGTYVDQKLLNSLPILPDNFPTLPKEQQQNLIKEYLEDEDKYVKDLIQNAESMENETVGHVPEIFDQPQEKISSPHLFNIRPNSRKLWEENDYYRSAADPEELDDIITQQKGMVDSLKRDADHNQDIMLISYLGESLIKDIERQRDKSTRTKRQLPLNTLPLTRLISDPATTMDLPKTLENLGVVARRTFEDVRAPVYHVRSMLGNTKDFAMSALKMIPNNILIPSRYEIKNLGENIEEVGAINKELLNAKTKGSKDTTTHKEAPVVSPDSFGMADTFKRIGEIIRDSVNSGKNSFVHAGNAANDAKHIIMTARHSAPRLVFPKIPTLTSTNSPRKAMFITPRLLDLSESTAIAPQRDFVGIGHILDAVGISSPTAPNVELEKIVIEPKNALTDLKSWGKPKELRSSQAFKEWLESIRVERVKDDNFDDATVGRGLNDLDSAKKSVGANSLRDFFDKMRESFNEALRSELQEKKIKRRKKQKNKKKKNKKTENFDTNSTVVLGSGLNLPNELMHPFMNQPSKTQLKQYLEENGDEKVIEEENLGAPLNRNRNDELSHILGAMNPLMFEQYFNDTLKTSSDGYLNPEEMFSVIHKGPDNKNETVASSRTVMKVPNQMLKPFMGIASKKKEFLDSYNKKPEEYEEQYYQEEHIPENYYVDTYY